MAGRVGTGWIQERRPWAGVAQISADRMSHKRRYLASDCSRGRSTRAVGDVPRPHPYRRYGSVGGHSPNDPLDAALHPCRSPWSNPAVARRPSLVEANEVRKRRGGRRCKGLIVATPSLMIVGVRCDHLNKHGVLGDNLVKKRRPLPSVLHRNLCRFRVVGMRRTTLRIGGSMGVRARR